MLEFLKNGPLSAIAKLGRWLNYKIRSYLGILDPVHTHRIKLARQLDAKFYSTVHYGIFAGLRLSPESWWGFTSPGAMLLGIYELEVLKSLELKPDNHRIFIDVGAADGYYAVGTLVSGLFDRTYCYEASENGREVILRNATNNGVLDRLVIHGFADKNFLDLIPPEDLLRAVVLIDIEGGEFDLLTSTNLEKLRCCIVFIEIHEWCLEGGSAKLQELLKRCRMTHSVTEITTTSRDLSGFPELREMSDTDRWLVCSEGRQRLMIWLRLDPL